MGTLSCHGPELTILGGSAAWPEIEFEKNEGGGCCLEWTGSLVRLDPGEVSEWRVPWAKEEVVRSTKKKMGRAWGE